MSSENRPLETASAKPRRSYSTPQLKLYGDVRELTASGMGSRMENTGADIMSNKFI